MRSSGATRAEVQLVQVAPAWLHRFPYRAPDTSVTVVRPDDLLVLTFDRVNLSLATADGETQLVKSGPGTAYLVVEFPPQNILEEVYFEVADDLPVEMPPLTVAELVAKGYPVTFQGILDYIAEVPERFGDDDASKGSDETPAPPPIPSLISRPSRIVFQVPDEALPIPWTTDGLLGAMGALPMSLPGNALPPKPSWQLVPGLAILGTLAETAVGSLVEGLEQAVQPGRTAGGLSRRASLSRARRKARTVGNALGLTEVTGSITRAAGRGEWALKPDLGGVLAALHPTPHEPTETQTAIETPYELIVAPNRHGAWAHATRPVTSPATGKTELWHTRLGVRLGNGQVLEGVHPWNTLRAVWTRAHPAPKKPDFGAAVETPGHVKFPFRRTLDSFDHHNVVHLSSNFALEDGSVPGAYYEPEPMDVERFMLSSLGAWMDTRGAWDFPQPRGLSVEEWRHRATMGRDHYVRVVYSGYLYPFRHRASVIKISERKLHPDMEDDPAYLRQRMYLVVREPVKSYRASGLQTADGEAYDRMIPFEAVRITNLVSPSLDDPADTEVAGGEAQSGFWPFVAGAPYLFHLVATDVDGNRVELAAPMIFVGKEHTDQDLDDGIVETVRDEYEAQTGRNTIDLFGQKVAFAPSAAPDDTAFEVAALRFGGEVPDHPDGAPLYDTLDWRAPRFHPVVRRADLRVPSVQQIAGTSDPVSMEYADAFLTEPGGDGFGGGNSGEVFLQVHGSSSLGVNFSSQSDRAGGFVSPDLDVSGLSRKAGPVSGDVGVAAAGTFSPTEYFGALLDAKIFGLFTLDQILGDALFDELEKIPRFTGQSLNVVEQLLSSLERMASALKGGALGSHAALDRIDDWSSGAAITAAGLGSLQTELADLATKLGDQTNWNTGPGVKAVVEEQLATIEGLLANVLANAGVLDAFAAGDELPTAVNARLEWRPKLVSFGPFTPNNERGLLIAVEAAADVTGQGAARFTAAASLEDFELDLHVLVLDFERLQFRVRDGHKPDVDVVFKDYRFAGPLSFVEALRDLIPSDGFSDPPDLQVTPAGVTASYTQAIPNVGVGVFALENLSLSAGFDIPFTGDPISTWLDFSKRESPALLSVGPFGGGAYVGFTINPGGLVVLEGALEFGASISVNLGIASGSVSAMAGIYYKIEVDQVASDLDVTLAGYFRLRGEVRVLWISISIEVYLELRYESASGKCIGTASISVEVDMGLFSVTVSASVTKKFAGSGQDPTFHELMDVQPDGTSPDWEEYCAAFAA